MVGEARSLCYECCLSVSGGGRPKYADDHDERRSGGHHYYDTITYTIRTIQKPLKCSWSSEPVRHVTSRSTLQVPFACTHEVPTTYSLSVRIVMAVFPTSVSGKSADVRKGIRTIRGVRYGGVSFARPFFLLLDKRNDDDGLLKQRHPQRKETAPSPTEKYRITPHQGVLLGWP